MKRIWLDNGDYIDIESLGRDHGIRIRLADKMGYAKEYKYFTDAELLKMFGYSKETGGGDKYDRTTCPSKNPLTQRATCAGQNDR